MSLFLSTSFTLSSLLSLTSIISTTNADTYCYNNRECFGQTIHDVNIECLGPESCRNGTVTCNGDGNCQCDGYKGCFEAVVDSANKVTCDSDYSCALSTISSTGEDTTDNLYCDGRLSCYRTVFTNGYNLYCDGENGCRESLVEDNGDALEFTLNRVICGGDYGCHYMTINDVYDIHGYGYFALRYGYIKFKALNPLNRDRSISLGGFKTAQFADLYCEQLSACEILCESENACADLDVYCYSQDCDITCDYGGCPTVYNYFDDDIDEDTKKTWDNYRKEKGELRAEYEGVLDEKLMEVLEKRMNNLRVKYGIIDENGNNLLSSKSINVINDGNVFSDEKRKDAVITVLSVVMASLMIMNVFTCYKHCNNIKSYKYQSLV